MMESPEMLRRRIAQHELIETDPELPNGLRRDALARRKELEQELEEVSA